MTTHAGTQSGFALFETAIGRCAVAWGDAGIVGIQLPEASVQQTRARMRSRFPNARELAPPPRVRKAIADMAALLDGERRDLSGIVLDMERVAPFHRRVYLAARKIAAGSTLSYGEIAKRIGSPGSARAVGQALGRNPFAIVVPCHRVLAAGGKPGGFSADGGTTTKLRMLAIEGAPANGSAVAGARAGTAKRATTARRRAATAERGATAGARRATTAERNPPTAVAAHRGRNGLGFDAALALAHLRASDSRLATLIDSVGPFDMSVKKTSSLFAALAEAIVYQQLSGKAAETIFARVCALVPGGRTALGAATLSRLSDAQLRGAGLSRAKLAALRDLASKAEAGELPTLAALARMEDAEIVERLTRVRGIGRWTVEMLLMFRLGRPDVLPAEDYGIRKGFALTFRSPELPDRKTLERRAVRWQPYRTVASWYLWRALERAGA